MNYRAILQMERRGRREREGERWRGEERKSEIKDRI